MTQATAEVAKAAHGVQHATLVLTQHINAPLPQVFAAWASATERARWGSPSDTAAIVYDAANFAVDGRDSYRCGGKNDLRFRCEVHYLDIVNNQRIVYAERVNEGDTPLSATLNTVELRTEGAQTRVQVTIQITALAGPGIVSGTEHGTRAALANLARTLVPTHQ